MIKWNSPPVTTGQLTGCGLGGTIVPTRHIGGGRAHMYMYEKARALASLSVRLKEEEGGGFFRLGKEEEEDVRYPMSRKSV